jgi:hypothetical protein
MLGQRGTSHHMEQMSTRPATLSRRHACCSPSQSWYFPLPPLRTSFPAYWSQA